MNDAASRAVQAIADATTQQGAQDTKQSEERTKRARLDALKTTPVAILAIAAAAWRETTLWGMVLIVTAVAAPYALGTVIDRIRDIVVERKRKPLF